MSIDACVVLTTTANIDDADALAKVLVEQRLVACVQMLPITSVFEWKGAVSRESEILMLLKAPASLYGELEAAIRANHKYEVPEVIMVPVAAAFDAYVSWMSQVTK